MEVLRATNRSGAKTQTRVLARETEEWMLSPFLRN
jgi:hypothetical protein